MKSNSVLPVSDLLSDFYFLWSGQNNWHVYGMVQNLKQVLAWSFLWNTSCNQLRRKKSLQPLNLGVKHTDKALRSTTEFKSPNKRSLVWIYNVPFYPNSGKKPMSQSLSEMNLESWMKVVRKLTMFHVIWTWVSTTLKLLIY